MGFFDWLFGSKRTYVSSVVYNMAGPEKDRPDYLKSLIVQNVLSSSKRSMGDSIKNGYMYGPAIQLRSFYRWAENNYGLIGMPKGSIENTTSVNPQDVAPHIPHGSGEAVWVQDTELGIADYTMWAQQWILANRPDQENTNWISDINESNQITIWFVDNTSITFIPNNFDKNGRYIYAFYNLTLTPQESPIVSHGTTNVDSGVFPDVTGWKLISSVSQPQTRTLTTTTTTSQSYSDGRPDTGSTSSSSISQEYTYKEWVYERDIPLETVNEALISERQTYYLKEDQETETSSTSTTNTYTVDNGTVTVTEVVITTTQFLEPERSYSYTTQERIGTTFLPTQLFIYRVGTGITGLDALVQSANMTGQFYPFIPVRLNNKFVTEPGLYPDEVSNIIKKAYKKALKNKYDKLIEKIETHASLGDMDFIYVCFGVSLNVVENASKKYLYAFFKKLMADQTGGPNAYNTFVVNNANYNQAHQTWVTWQAAQLDPNHALYGTPEPIRANRPSLFRNSIEIKSTGSINSNYNININWAYIEETLNITGVGKAGAKKGDYWFTFEGSDTLLSPFFSSSGAGILGSKRDFYNKQVFMEKVRLWHQVDTNRYEYLDIVGLTHRNWIYNGKYSEISAKEAIESIDESGFIVPLHDQIFRETSLISSTQMTTACVYIVINCYKVVKQNFFETWFFKILLVVGIAILTGGLGGGATIGLLGANAAIGAAIGLTGMTAVIVGSIANALAALVLTTLLEVVATSVFGPQIGTIIATVIGFFAMQMASSIHSTGAFNFNWGDIIKVDNIMMLTNAVGKGYAAFVQGAITDMQADLEQYQDQASEEAKQAQQAYYEMFGYNAGGNIDPMMLISSNPIIAESSDTFLTRTLLSGSDIVDMSMDMLNNYVELTMTLPDAFV